MKSWRFLIIALLALFAMMMLIEFSRPKHYDWTQSFAHNSVQPFGCALVDSVLSSSLPQGYKTSSLTLAQLASVPGTDSRHVYMIVKSGDFFSESDERAILDLLDRGNDLLIVTNSLLYADSLSAQLGYAASGTWYESSVAYDLKDEILHNKKRPITWVGDGNYPARDWIIPHSLKSYSILHDLGNSVTPLLVQADTIESDTDYAPAVEFDTLACVSNRLKGRAVICVTPLMITNYAFIYCDGASYTLRLLGQLHRYPVIRVDLHARTQAGGVSESPLRYILGQRPLRWATYLLIGVVLLAMLFTARRRQRVIPVMQQPVNRALEMAKHIGSLYFQRHDNADLLTKKYQYFVEEVRKLTMIDLEDALRHEDSLLQLQHITGIAREELGQQLSNIAAWTQSAPGDRELMQCIDYLNYVLNKIKN